MTAARRVATSNGTPVAGEDVCDDTGPAQKKKAAARRRSARIRGKSTVGERRVQRQQFRVSSSVTRQLWTSIIFSLAFLVALLASARPAAGKSSVFSAWSQVHSGMSDAR